MQVLERIAARACYGFFGGLEFVGTQNWKEYLPSPFSKSNIDCYQLVWDT